MAEFARLEASSVEAEEPTANQLAAAGLSPPRVTLRALGGEAEGTVAEVFLGEYDPSAGFAAQSGGRTKIYRLDPALAEQIPDSIEAFRSEFLAPPESAVVPSETPAPE